MKIPKTLNNMIIAFIESAMLRRMAMTEATSCAQHPGPESWLKPQASCLNHDQIYRDHICLTPNHHV